MEEEAWGREFIRLIPYELRIESGVPLGFR
jgi:hypothetical protein